MVIYGVALILDTYPRFDPMQTDEKHLHFGNSRWWYGGVTLYIEDKKCNGPQGCKAAMQGCKAEIILLARIKDLGKWHFEKRLYFRPLFWWGGSFVRDKL